MARSLTYGMLTADEQRKYDRMLETMRQHVERIEDAYERGAHKGTWLWKMAATGTLYGWNIVKDVSVGAGGYLYTQHRIDFYLISLKDKYGCDKIDKKSFPPLPEAPLPPSDYTPSR